MVATDPFEKLDGTTPAAKPKKITRKKSSTSSKSATTKKRRTTKKKRTRRTSSKVKQGSKVSTKWFFVWCGVFLLIFMILMLAWVFWVINSPSMLESLGMDIGQVKTLLYLFSSLFFGIITIALLFWLFLSLYRVATKKWNKLKYVIWLISSLVLLIGIVIWWVYAINRISELSSGKIVTNNPVLVYLETKDGPVFVEDGIKLIAPMSLRFGLNTSIFQRDIQRDIWQSSSVSSIQLDCGNEQILNLSSGDAFGGDCLYMDKQEYSMTMIVNYVTSDGTAKTNTYPAGTFTPEAAIQIEPLDQEWTYNDKKDEYIIGTAPVPVRFRSERLFSDLGLDDDNILWDFDADGKVDFTNQASFQTSFDESRLHKVAFQLPDLPGRGDTRYQFELRVVESELASCTLDKENTRDNRWKLTPRFDEDLQIAQYKYTIYDTLNEDVIDTPKGDPKWWLSYNFPDGANYEISMIYITKDGQKWSCKPIEITQWYAGNQAEFVVYHKHNQDDPYAEVDTSTTQAIRDGEKITTELIPSTFQIQVERTVPDANADVEVFFNGREIFPTNRVYEFTVNQEWLFDLEFVVTNDKGKSSTQTYPVLTSRNSVEALIKVNGEPVGEDPFEVELDASVSPLYDEDDEIVFFTRDFGDGEILQKVSQGKISHTYKFDAENTRGEFYPSVTVFTRKWFEDTYKLPEPIVVKRKQKEVEIFMESHPTQQASVGDTVRMSVRTDGLVDSIQRDFGNNRVVSCEGRECSSTATTYTEPGTYDIKVEVSYEDNIPAVQRMQVRVF